MPPIFCWMVKPGSPVAELGGEPRTPDGSIRSNGRFPDMKALAASIHAKGLKAGLYTSPGPLTCARFEGSYQHEEPDAHTFAEWGFDFLKYDLCSYRGIDNRNTVEADRKPYELMGSILGKLNRDIVLKLLEYAAPGKWNDPDYILIGTVGNAHEIDAPPVKTALTAEEQYSYMSMWALMASPLFYSGDMATLDEFTLNVLCNAEVIEVDQDSLGKQARIVRRTEDEFILAKPMADGSLAVGLFNLAGAARELSVTGKDLEIDGRRRVRDLWRQQDTETAAGEYKAVVPRHGVAQLRLFR